MEEEKDGELIIKEIKDFLIKSKSFLKLFQDTYSFLDILSKIGKDKNNNDPESKNSHQLLLESIVLAFKFYLVFLLLSVVFFSALYIIFNFFNLNLFISFIIIYFGNIFIVFINHWWHWLHASKSEEFKDFVYENFNDCFIRCSTGSIEMIFYTFFFSIDLPSIVIGYLIFRTISYWKPTNKNGENKNFGLSTATLRTTSILQLLISFFAAYYLKLFLIAPSYITFLEFLNSFKIN